MVTKKEPRPGKFAGLVAAARLDRGDRVAAAGALGADVQVQMLEVLVRHVARDGGAALADSDEGDGARLRVRILDAARQAEGGTVAVEGGGHGRPFLPRAPLRRARRGDPRRAVASKILYRSAAATRLTSS